MYFFKGDEKLLKLIEKKPVAINFMIEIELLSWPLLTSAHQNLLTNLVEDSYYFDYGSRIKVETINLKKIYRLKSADAFIAATALVHNLTLISADKVFSKIDNLSLISFIPSLS
jgi:hypothetical protein